MLSGGHPVNEEDGASPLGLVPVDGRGSLPFGLVHGESLVAAASWALTTAGVELVDLQTSFEELVESGRVLVVHDPLCPLTPAGFIGQAVAECESTGAVVVGVHPVTDTVKEYDAPAGSDEATPLGRTHAREELMSVASPVVLPPAALATLDGLQTDDLAAWVAVLAERLPVRFLEAPPLARRVGSEEDLDVLEALSEASASNG